MHLDVKCKTKIPLFSIDVLVLCWPSTNGCFSRENITDLQKTVHVNGKVYCSSEQKIINCTGLARHIIIQPWRYPKQVLQYNLPSNMCYDTQQNNQLLGKKWITYHKRNYFILTFKKFAPLIKVMFASWLFKRCLKFFILYRFDTIIICSGMSAIFISTRHT